MRRVAVTGLGAVTPLGNDWRSTWDAAVAGRSGIDFITRVRRERVPRAHRGRGEGLRSGGGRRPKEARRLDRNVLLSLAAAEASWADAGLEGVYDPARRGPLRDRDRRDHRDRRAARRSCSSAAPTGVAVLHPQRAGRRASGRSRSRSGCVAPNYAPVSACATGSTAIGEAAEVIRRGDADAVLAGGAEAAVTPLILAGFCAMRGLAAEEEYPPRASRPFDATRAGFVMGEGACVLVLEEIEGARARGAHVYAEVLGYGASNDAYHLAAPDPEAVGVAEMMRAALGRAGLEPEASDTSTRTGPRRRSATSPRPGRSSRSSATTPTSSRSPRRSRCTATASGRPARSRR